MRYLILLLVALYSAPGFAAEVSEAEGVRLVWLAICCALVLVMQVGFLLLEGGLVRSKNSINVILKNFTDVGLGTMGYWAVGFGLMFGLNETGFLGTSDFFYSPEGSTDTMNLLYNMMFAATAATIMSGAVAERFSFVPYIIGAFVLTSLIYPVFGSWVWGGAGSGDNAGWLAKLGFPTTASAPAMTSGRSPRSTKCRLTASSRRSSSRSGRMRAAT